MGRPSRRTLAIAGAVLVVVVALVAAYLVFQPDLSQHRVQRLFRQYGYVVVFVPVFLETAGVPLPGETVLLLAGVAASTGTINVVLAIAVGALAAILGDNLGFAVGRYGGRRVVERLADIGGVSRSLAWGEDFFARHGGKTVFLARWIAGLRIFGAWIAGMVHMSWPRFFVFNALGGIAWATTVVLAGYLFARSLGGIERALGLGGAIAAGIVVVVVAGALARHLHRRQRAQQR